VTEGDTYLALEMHSKTQFLFCVKIILSYSRAETLSRLGYLATWCIG